MRKPEAWQMELQAELDAGFLLQPLALASSPKEAGNNSTKGGQDGKAGRPVAMQLSEEELKGLSAKLTPGCEARFSALLEGKGPPLHTFGIHDSSEASCQSLNGSLCETQAHVQQGTIEMQDGRKMSSAVDVTGKGCLPRECMAATDLQVLASFMQGKAKETIPGMDAHVALHVDCSKSGGRVATVGQNEEKDHDGGGDARPGLSRSSSHGLSSGMLVVVVSLLATATALADSEGFSA